MRSQLQGSKGGRGRCWTVPRLWSHSYLRGRHEVCGWKQLIGLGGHCAPSERNLSLVVEAVLSGLRGWRRPLEKKAVSLWDQQRAHSLIIHMYLGGIAYYISELSFFLLKNVFIISYSQVISRSGCLIKEAPEFENTEEGYPCSVWWRLC